MPDKGNGKDDLNEKLDLVLSVLEQLVEDQTLFKEEVLEKLENISLPGGDYGVEYEN